MIEFDGERHILFPLWANGERGGELRRGTPVLNADGAAVLRELGFSQDEADRILASTKAKA